MKNFAVVILALIFAFPALAQTPVTKEMGDKYYENCMIQNPPKLTAESKEIMCGCTTQRMMETFTVEDIQIMGSDTPEARLVVNKLLLEVYSPCIEEPARDYYYFTCLENPDTKSLTNDPDKLCDCMASEVAAFLGDNAVGVFTDVLDKDPRAYDPMEALANDPDFQKYAQSKLMSCYQNFQ